MIIWVGISVGFLLGIGVSSLTRAMIAGGDRGLETTFTAIVILVAGLLITYGLKSTPVSPQMVDTGNEDSLSRPQSSPTKANEITTVPIAIDENGVLAGNRANQTALVNGYETPVAAVPAVVEPVID